VTDHVEVFADITCPFTHVGLKRVVAHLDRLPDPVELHVRAWPLEWVNGQPLDADAVAVKARVLHDQLGVDDFGGFDAAVWPASTIPALNLAAAGYGRDWATGLAVSLDLRRMLFEQGGDVGDPDVLADLAAAHGLAAPPLAATPAVRVDYEAGIERGVTGSPHFFCRGADFFCPALDIGHDRSGGLTARFDPEGLAAFLHQVHPLGEGDRT
jgi:predicted DsbA family dithiol-disulfide isomerase